MWIGEVKSGGKSGGKSDLREKEGLDRCTGEPGTGKKGEGIWCQGRGTGCGQAEENHEEQQGQD